VKISAITIGLCFLFGCGARPDSTERASVLRAHADVVSRVDVRVGYFDETLEGRDPRHRDLPEPALQYGQPEWDYAARAELDALALGERWALGRDFWTTLDVNSGLSVGDAELTPGKYYLALERSDDEFDLILLDSKQVRAAGLDISRVGETTAGHRTALAYTRLDELAERLSLQFEFPVADTPPGLVDLRIRFGPHQWRVDLLADVETSGKDVEPLGLEAPRRIARFIHDRGVVTVGYGQPEWKPEYVEQFDAVTKGKRWRLGRNWWTTLDTNIALTLGELTIEPGDYYLVGERPADSEDWHLRILDPAAVRTLQLDPVMAFETTGGQSVKLKHELTESVNELMAIEIYPDESDSDAAMLTAWWGNHRLSVHMRLDP
jgi:hypothetical protein